MKFLKQLIHKLKNDKQPDSRLVTFLDETRTLRNLFHHNQQRIPNSLINEWNLLSLELREDLQRHHDYQRNIAGRLSPAEPERAKESARRGLIGNLHMARFKNRLWRLVLRILKEDMKKNSALLEAQHYKKMVLTIERYLGWSRWLWGIFDRVPDIVSNGIILIVKLILGGVAGALVSQYFLDWW